MEVLIALVGVAVMCGVAYRTVYKRPPIFPAVAAAVSDAVTQVLHPPVDQEGGGWEPFVGNLDWPSEWPGGQEVDDGDS